MQLSVCVLLYIESQSRPDALFLLASAIAHCSVGGAQWRPAQGRLINQSASYKVRGSQGTTELP